MESGRHRWTLIVRSVLLALVLAAQASVIAHAFEHDANAADPLCATCSAGYAQQATTVDTGTVAPSIPASVTPFDPTVPESVPVRVSTCRARAPPFSL